MNATRMTRDGSCSFPDCGRSIYAKRLCATHYQQQRTGKDLAPIGVSRRRTGACEVDGCVRAVWARGVCQRHYDVKRNESLRQPCPGCESPMSPGSQRCSRCHLESVRNDWPDQKICPQCGQVKPVDSFRPLRWPGMGSKSREACQTCSNLNDCISVKTNGDDPSKLRSYARKLGISWAEVVERYPVDGRCEICGHTQREAQPAGIWSNLSLDHCHDSNRLRGFLCSPCNLGLGKLGDTTERVAQALAYLTKKGTER
jgi:hypothetical protein